MQTKFYRKKKLKIPKNISFFNFLSKATEKKYSVMLFIRRFFNFPICFLFGVEFTAKQ